MLTWDWKQQIGFSCFENPCVLFSTPSKGHRFSGATLRSSSATFRQFQQQTASHSHVAAESPACAEAVEQGC
jgi:hypothetical protein